MDIETRQTGKAVILQPKGTINIQSSPEFRDALLKAFGKGDGRCVINLSEVTYIDSSGLATLVEGLQLAQKGGGVFALCAIEHPMIKDLLELTHLTEAFTIFESEAEAIA